MQLLVPAMTPAPGERLQRFAGDRIRFRLKDREGRRLEKGWVARLRTNLGRAEVLRREILQAHTRGLPLAGSSWRDLAMVEDGEGWALDLPLPEVGYFKAKAYLLDPRGWQHWPEGPDVGISVHPQSYRTGNTIYCAFTRMFGPTKAARATRDAALERVLTPLDEKGYTVIPPSGKLRDLVQCLPHIMETLGCRIIQLLPVNPTPTTFARFGRYGSPYAALDLTAIDPALVEFDQRTTGIDQFRELTYAVHLRDGRVFLDIVINHTGWGSVLQERHPEWFLRHPDGRFASPGAWGVTWEDLVELRHVNVALWDELAEVFLTWCRRGVDGFRCDAGYKVPVAAWQYIVARVQQEYPETIFLLEGLGGAWEATEALLTDGGMQWAYSELFQNYSGYQVSTYLDHSFRQTERVGLLVHYSETHDNERLAARGRAWSLLRNRLCALASMSGGFAFTCGVEWLATEKIDVHDSTGMAWGSPDNLLPELGKLNALLSEHPCFFDGAKPTRLSPLDSPVFALRRESAEGTDVVLVLVNTDMVRPGTIALEASSPLPPPPGAGRERMELERWVDLLGQPVPGIQKRADKGWLVTLAPGAAYCLAPALVPRGLHGAEYRRARARASRAMMALNKVLPLEEVGELDWHAVAQDVDRFPDSFLAALAALAETPAVPGRCRVTRESLQRALHQAIHRETFSQVVTWTPLEARRITPVPPGHWLFIRDTVPFRAALDLQDGSPVQNVESMAVQNGYVTAFAPRQDRADATLFLERYGGQPRHLQAAVRYLASGPEPVATRLHTLDSGLRLPSPGLQPTNIVLLTNGRGGMARLCVDLGRVQSKYDCVLGANLHPSLPVDRHVFAKRIRVWVNADGFISPLDFRSLAEFEPGPPAVWDFVADAGDGRTVEIQMTAEMLEEQNTTVFHFTRPTAAQATGKQLPSGADVRLTVRLDLEDRNFHWETKRNGGAELHFNTHTHTLGTGQEPEATPGQKVGFAFTPAPDRQLHAYVDRGWYHPQPEWSENIPHPVEQSRGQTGSGDAYSPGWFELPLPKGAKTTLIVTAENPPPETAELDKPRFRVREQPQADMGVPTGDSFGQQLVRAARSFVVRRGHGKTVIAGYPWFLDWGRDTFICARGLLAAGMVEEVKQLLVTFAHFEKDGTLPNTIFGEDASNRDTSDAPLWFGVVCEEVAALTGPELYATQVGKGSATLADTLQSIALNYIRGTPNRIRMDPASALVWSPSHFTWMDTNYPAGTPREGYPVEIQALWIRLLRQLDKLGGGTERRDWHGLAAQALASLEKLFWLEQRGYYSDLLIAKQGQPASAAVVDDALRSNCLFLVSLGLVSGVRARRCVEAALRYLVVPGALRTLAPLPVTVPLPVYGNDGRLLNNPAEPYWGRYEGDEDTRRKPAYHNGTAWTWTFPVFCEALARAWDFAPVATAAAKAYLGSMDRLMAQGCLGQLPEIVDGDAPHTPRGCDAQSWGATEALRVWRLLHAV